MGGNTTSAANPAPIDYSAQMMQMSKDNAGVQMAHVGAQIIGMELMSSNRSEQTGAATLLGQKALNNEVRIAEMQYRGLAKADGNKHEDTMKELDVRKSEILASSKNVDLNALMA